MIINNTTIVTKQTKNIFILYLKNPKTNLNYFSFDTKKEFDYLNKNTA